MGKGKDAKKSVKKEPAKTAKEKKAEKRLKKAKQAFIILDLGIMQCPKSLTMLFTKRKDQSKIN